MHDDTCEHDALKKLYYSAGFEFICVYYGIYIDHLHLLSSVFGESAPSYIG